MVLRVVTHSAAFSENTLVRYGACAKYWAIGSRLHIRLTERPNQLRLASRDLCNQYFRSVIREQAIEAEARHSNILEHLFRYIALEPKNRGIDSH